MCYLWTMTANRPGGPSKLHPKKKFQAHSRYVLKCLFSPDSTWVLLTQKKRRSHAKCIRSFKQQKKKKNRSYWHDQCVTMHVLLVIFFIFSIHKMLISLKQVKSDFIHFVIDVLNLGIRCWSFSALWYQKHVFCICFTSFFASEFGANKSWSWFLKEMQFLSTRAL